MIKKMFLDHQKEDYPGEFCIPVLMVSQAYTKKGRTPIQIFPVPNAYTNSFVITLVYTFRFI